MAEERNNQQVVGYPTREIRVTGERVASMVHASVAVSRFEIQLIKMSMSGAQPMREGVRKASERFQSALNDFEASLRECQRDLDIASKRQRPSGKKDAGQQNQKPNQPKLAKPGAKQKQGQQPTSAPAANKSNGNATPNSSAPKGQQAQGATAKQQAKPKQQPAQQHKPEQSKPQKESQQEAKADQAKNSPEAKAIKPEQQPAKSEQTASTVPVL